MVCHPSLINPEGDAQDVHRFSKRQDVSSKNTDHLAVGRFASALSVFFGYFLYAKESNSRTQREKVPSFTRILEKIDIDIDIDSDQAGATHSHSLHSQDASGSYAAAPAPRAPASREPARPQCGSARAAGALRADVSSISDRKSVV